LVLSSWFSVLGSQFLVLSSWFSSVTWHVFCYSGGKRCSLCPARRKSMQQDPYDRRVVQEEIVRTPEGVDASVVEHRTHIDPTPAERQFDTLYRAKQVLWLIVGLIVALIGIRFVLLLLGANMNTGFGGFVLSITQPFMAPFLPLFGEQAARVEFSALIAMAVYLLVGWAISKLLEIILAPRTPPAGY
jgi:uncharacterized protein YggT (Ycf19 family)